MAEKTNPQAPAEIVASRAPRRDSVNLEARRDGVVVEAMTFHREHAASKVKFAKKAGTTVEAVQQKIDTIFANGATVNGNGAAAASLLKFHLILRGMHQPKGAGRRIEDDKPLDAVKTALAILDYPASEPVMEWDSTREVACLDIDFHGLLLDQRPGVAQLQAVAAAVQPQPALYWPTHGRGLRLVYAADGGFQADELAACAALGVMSLEPAATLEILARTRHPAYPRPGYPSAGAVVEGTPTVEIGALSRWLGRELDDAFLDEWLAEQGYEKDRKYRHDRCPVDPTAPSHGEPVFVGDAGISCMKCQASGITLGSRKAGFFPYPALIGGGISSRLRQAARYFCHWEHAQHIVAEDIGITGTLAKSCYSALLKAVNGPDDPRNNEAMYRGEGLVRMDGYWATADLTRAHAKDGLADRLAKLPAVRYRTKDDLAVNDERLGIFRGVDDLASYGYPRVQPVRGMKISGHFSAGQDPRVVRAVILPGFLSVDAAHACRPRYVQASKRMPLADAERIISGSFPGVNYNYLKLLIAARGCAEGGVGQPPMIAVDGPAPARAPRWPLPRCWSATSTSTCRGARTWSTTSRDSTRRPTARAW